MSDVNKGGILGTATFPSLFLENGTGSVPSARRFSISRKSSTRKLDAVNREFAAIGAYETAKTGKAARQASAGRQSRTRRGSRREALLEIIRQSDGLSRGEILERMGLKGDKSGEMSVSNALTALTKSNQVRREDGKYRAAT